MSTLPTRAIAHAYITEHDLQNILNRAVNACVHAKAADPIGFIIDHLKAVKEAAASNTMVAQKKEEEATTSEMKEKRINKPWRRRCRRSPRRRSLIRNQALLLTRTMRHK